MSDQDEVMEEECACFRVDVDLDDASLCPIHGPNSEMAKRQRAQEAEAEAAFWGNISPWWEKEDSL